MTFRIASAVASLSLCGLVGAASATPPEPLAELSPLEAVLLATPPDFVAAVPGVTDGPFLGVGPLAPPDLAAVLGVVLPEPIDPWIPAGPPPTLADVISVVSLANWTPYDPQNPDNGWGGEDNVISETSAAWQAQMAAYHAQTAESNAEQMNAFSEAIQAQFDVAMDPGSLPFDNLLVSELIEDGGFIMSEFHWGRGDTRHVADVFAKYRKSQSGFFGE